MEFEFRQATVEGAQRRVRASKGRRAQAQQRGCPIAGTLRPRGQDLPPEILLAGARQSQDVKCFAVGHAERVVPHSPTSLSAR
jgi:hypothetical protein